LATYVPNWHKLELPQEGRSFSEENNTGVRRQFVFPSLEDIRAVRKKKKKDIEHKEKKDETRIGIFLSIFCKSNQCESNVNLKKIYLPEHKF
jgi:uncharacterized protein with ParB-like and HNH nuclease domain